MSSGEQPIGTAKGKQPNTEALCQPPPPFAFPFSPLRMLHVTTPHIYLSLHGVNVSTIIGR